MFLDEDTNCSWCGADISRNNLKAKTNDDVSCVFCDYACAKLYNDKLSKLAIDYSDYNELYVNGKLNNMSRKLFSIVRNNGFYILPTIYRDVDISTFETRKKLSIEYRTMLCQ